LQETRIPIDFEDIGCKSSRADVGKKKFYFAGKNCGGQEKNI